MSHQVFISYRRDGGEALARLLYDQLSAKGYDVFYDVESLSAGEFNLKLLDEIDKSTDFVLVLPPMALDRCVNSEDWVRKEIERAFAMHKNIVPVMMRGFVFPDPSELPEGMRGLPMKNGVSMDMEYFDAVVDRLCSMLRSVPANHDAVRPAGSKMSGKEKKNEKLKEEAIKEIRKCRLLFVNGKVHPNLPKPAVSDAAREMENCARRLDAAHSVTEEDMRVLLRTVDENLTEIKKQAKQEFDIYLYSAIEELTYTVELWIEILSGKTGLPSDAEMEKTRQSRRQRKFMQKLAELEELKGEIYDKRTELEELIRKLEKVGREQEEKLANEQNERMQNDLARDLDGIKAEVASLAARSANYQECFYTLDLIYKNAYEAVTVNLQIGRTGKEARVLLQTKKLRNVIKDPDSTLKVMKKMLKILQETEQDTQKLENAIREIGTALEGNLVASARAIELRDQIWRKRAASVSLDD